MKITCIACKGISPAKDSCRSCGATGTITRNEQSNHQLFFITLLLLFPVGLLIVLINVLLAKTRLVRAEKYISLSYTIPIVYVWFILGYTILFWEQRRYFFTEQLVVNILGNLGFLLLAMIFSLFFLIKGKRWRSKMKRILARYLEIVHLEYEHSIALIAERSGQRRRHVKQELQHLILQGEINGKLDEEGNYLILNS